MVAVAGSVSGVLSMPLRSFRKRLLAMLPAALMFAGLLVAADVLGYDGISFGGLIYGLTAVVVMLSLVSHFSSKRSS